MKTEQREKIEKHGRQLQAIFPAVADLDPVELCKKLRRIENRTNRAACEACNTQKGADEWEYWHDKAMADLDVLLILGDIPVFINGDPRGYSLKINDDWMRDHPEIRLHQDWGGYGIIAPEIE